MKKTNLKYYMLIKKGDFLRADLLLPYLGISEEEKKAKVALNMIHKYEAKLAVEQEVDQAISQVLGNTKWSLKCLFALKRHDLSAAMLSGRSINRQNASFDVLAKELASYLLAKSDFATLLESKGSEFFDAMLTYFIEAKLVQNSLGEACAALNFMSACHHRDLIANKVFMACLQALELEACDKILGQIISFSMKRNLDNLFEQRIINLSPLECEIAINVKAFLDFAEGHCFEQQVDLCNQLRLADNKLKLFPILVSRLIKTNQPIDHVLWLLENYLSQENQVIIKHQLALKYLENKKYVAAIRCADAIPDPELRSAYLREILAQPPFYSDTYEMHIDLLAQLIPQEKNEIIPELFNFNE